MLEKSYVINTLKKFFLCYIFFFIFIAILFKLGWVSRMDPYKNPISWEKIFKKIPDIAIQALIPSLIIGFFTKGYKN